jgi:hypothetical protein
MNSGLNLYSEIPSLVNLTVFFPTNPNSLFCFTLTVSPDHYSKSHCLFHFFTLYPLCNSGGQKAMVSGSVLTLGTENSQ